MGVQKRNYGCNHRYFFRAVLRPLWLIWRPPGTRLPRICLSITPSSRLWPREWDGGIGSMRFKYALSLSCRGSYRQDNGGGTETQMQSKSRERFTHR